MQRAVIDQVHIEPTHLHHPAVTSQLTRPVTRALSRHRQLSSIRGDGVYLMGTS